MKAANNIFAPSPRPLSVAVLVLDGCNTLSLAAAVDPLRAANRMARAELFRWRFLTAEGASAGLTSGLMVEGEAIARAAPCDLLIVCASFELTRHDTPALRASLRRIAAAGTVMAGVDGGPWLLAAAGILDDFQATTHWEDIDLMAERFPAVRVVQDRFHIDRGRMTCGGAAPAIDMMLHLIAARCGAALAARVAGVFIYDTAPDPARAQRRTGPRPNHSGVIQRATQAMEDTLDAPLPLPAIARRAGTSPRALQAQFRARMGTTPQAHYLSLRLTEALRLVRETDRSLTEIALATGFGSASSFSRAFREAHGQSARAIRSGSRSSS